MTSKVLSVKVNGYVRCEHGLCLDEGTARGSHGAISNRQATNPHIDGCHNRPK